MQTSMQMWTACFWAQVLFDDLQNSGDALYGLVMAAAGGELGDLVVKPLILAPVARGASSRPVLHLLRASKLAQSTWAVRI